MCKSAFAFLSLFIAGYTQNQYKVWRYGASGKKALFSSVLIRQKLGHTNLNPEISINMLFITLNMKILFLIICVRLKNIHLVKVHFDFET